MTPMFAILDTVAGPKRITNRSVSTSWYRYLKSMRYPGLTALTNQSVEVEGVILLHVRIGDFCFRIWFCVHPSFAVALLFWTCFMDRVFLAIFTHE